MELAPSEEFDFKRGKGDVLLIACGALAREIVVLAIGSAVDRTSTAISRKLWVMRIAPPRERRPRDPARAPYAIPQ